MTKNSGSGFYFLPFFTENTIALIGLFLNLPGLDFTSSIVIRHLPASFA
jgi:hypothetical protein